MSLTDRLGGKKESLAFGDSVDSASHFEEVKRRRKELKLGKS